MQKKTKLEEASREYEQRVGRNPKTVLPSFLLSWALWKVSWFPSPLFFSIWPHTCFCCYQALFQLGLLLFIHPVVLVAYRPLYLHHVFPDCRISALSDPSQLLSCFSDYISPSYSPLKPSLLFTLVSFTSLLPSSPFALISSSPPCASSMIFLPSILSLSFTQPSLC